MKYLLLLLLCICIEATAQPSVHGLQFDSLATTWDEAIPLGNGTLGALIWNKHGKLRLSVDRADVWDLRPMKGLDRKEFSFNWIIGQVKNNDYKPVQQYFDSPYDKEPAPTKIPCGGIEFEIPDARVTSVSLDVQTALARVDWNTGLTLTSFVHATKPAGWFRFENCPLNFVPVIVPPDYEGKPTGGEVNSLLGDDLSRLGYKQGKVDKTEHSSRYIQQGWGGLTYEVAVQWRRKDDKTVEGTWSVSSHYQQGVTTASELVSAALTRGYSADLKSHLDWWKDFWQHSSIEIPSRLLERQWYLEQYKFGSASRRGAPPISLQAVWTADNGRIPPWKGDFHHDLNTQLSYWPAYSGNHLEEAFAYTDHLFANRENYKKFTRRFFGKDGIAVPGITTLRGVEMGGWSQYSLSPTVSSWLAQHFYWQWKYTADDDFLRTKAYPWVRDVATFVEQVTAVDKSGVRGLVISSSPEINDNDIKAWFFQTTNYDLALMKYVMKITSEMATATGNPGDAQHWTNIGSQFPEYALTSKHELMFAPSMAYNQSHRHFSHSMAIHPLGLIRWEDGVQSQEIIRNTVHLLDSLGGDWWCGFSYAWLANLKARMKDGDGAARALEIFANAFCLPNSFHANGDQTRSGYSKFTYGPFTLEGNFAFAAGLQEMLLQSYAGFIEVMPAVPQSWSDVSFHHLRAEGAFLVDARRRAGQIEEIRILAEKGGKTKLKVPFQQWSIASSDGMKLTKVDNVFVVLEGAPGGSITLTAKKD